MQDIYTLKGMNCQSCVRKIEQGMSAYAESVRVDFTNSLLHMTGARIPFSELKDRIAGLGHYELLEQQQAAQQAVQGLKAYYPLALIVVYLMIASVAGAQDFSDWMRHFMGGFFLAFSFFKLLNIHRFADSYAKYDLLAMRWKTYGVIYPFCELALGFAYLFNWQIYTVLWATLILMGFSTVGVLRSMKRKQNIRCACLGDLMDVPVSTVTLIEDIGMVAMALVMIYV